MSDWLPLRFLVPLAVLIGSAWWVARDRRPRLVGAGAGPRVESAVSDDEVSEYGADGVPLSAYAG